VRYTGSWKENSRKAARKLINSLLSYKLPSWLLIHHKDEDPFNNSLGNLEIVSAKLHSRIHGSYGSSKYGIPCRGNEKEYQKVYDAIRYKNPERREACRRRCREFLRKKRRLTKLENKGV